MLDERGSPLVGPAGQRPPEKAGEDRVAHFVGDHAVEDPLRRSLHLHVPAEDLAGGEGERGRSPAPICPTVTETWHGRNQRGKSCPSHSRASSLRYFSAVWAHCRAKSASPVVTTKLAVEKVAPFAAEAPKRASAGTNAAKRKSRASMLCFIRECRSNQANGEIFPTVLRQVLPAACQRANFSPFAQIWQQQFRKTAVSLSQVA